MQITRSPLPSIKLPRTILAAAIFCIIIIGIVADICSFRGGFSAPTKNGVQRSINKRENVKKGALSLPKKNERDHDREIHIAFLCVTCSYAYASRVRYAYNSWGALVHQYTRHNSTFTFVSNARLPDNVPTWVNPNDGGKYADAQDRFMAALLDVPVIPNATWIMMADDDAFVHFLNVERLVETLDPTISALYGNVQCGPKSGLRWLCGGGGVLISPALITEMREKADTLRKRPVDQFYDMHISFFIRQNRLGELIDQPGFHSQPPNYYKKWNKTIAEPVISFHYLDAHHQAKNGKPYGCQSRGCPPIYNDVYKKYLAKEAPITINSTIIHAMQDDKGAAPSRLEKSLHPLRYMQVL